MNAPDVSAPRASWQFRVLDMGLAVIAVVPGVVNIVVDDPAPVLTVILLGVTAVVLCGRRRAPWPVLAAVSVLAAIGDSRSFTLAICLAMFEVAVRVPIGRAVLGYLIAVGVPLLGTTVKIVMRTDAVATGDVTPAIGVGTSIIDPYVVLAFAAGIVVQSTRQRRRAQEALLEQRIESARALERARITAEMHDVVGHALTVMISLANGARSAWHTDPQRSTQALTHLGEVGATALEDMQRTLRVLRDADHELDEAMHHSGHDLSDIETMIEVFHTAGMPVTLRRIGDPIPESAMLHAAVHRIVQECLTNALRYAHGASTVDVSIGCSASAGTITITVVDDGAVTGSQSLGTARGLIGISERAASFGGSCTYGPQSPRGWAVTTTLRTERPR